MSRPMALGLVLLVLILTSQSDWKQDSKPELEDISSPVTKREMPLTNLEVVRREIILMQEKEIHELKLRVKSLGEQLKNCHFEIPDNSTYEVTASEQESDTELVNLSTEVVEPVSAKTAKLRGNVEASRGVDPSERPSELLATGDAFEMIDDEEKTGNW